MNGASDRELVDAVLAARDEEAFRALYHRHTPALYRLAIRLTADRDGRAEDLVQDCWIVATTRWSRFEWRSSLRTWLTGILLNMIREARRAWHRESIDPGWHEATTPAEPVDTRIDLEAAVMMLAAGYRAVFLLHDVEGYRHEEIADLLGIEVGTSKSQLARARRALRRWIDPLEGATDGNK